MSYSARDYDRDQNRIECACGALHPFSYKLTSCGHPKCEVIGCHLCLFECQVFSQCGHFCEDHVRDTDLGGALKTPIKSCYRCEGESEETEEPGEPEIAEAA